MLGEEGTTASVPIRSVSIVVDGANGQKYQTDIESHFFQSKRMIYLRGEVNDYTMHELMLQLQYLDGQDPAAPIHLHIFSPGGSVMAMLSAYDAIMGISAPIYTYCHGMAASAASLLFMTGTPGHRYIMPNARLMIHQLRGAGGGGGMFTEQQGSYFLSESFEDQLENIYAIHTGQPIEEIRAWMRSGVDKWVVPKEAVSKRYNFADQVVTVNTKGEPVRGYTGLPPVRSAPATTRRVKAAAKVTDRGKKVTRSSKQTPPRGDRGLAA